MENPNVVVTPPVKTPPKKSGLPVFLQAFLGVLVAVILIAAGAAGAYYLMQQSPSAKKPANDTVASNCLPGSLDCVNTSTGELPPIVLPTDSPTSTEASGVNWTAASQLSSLRLFKDEKTRQPKYYKVGEFTAGQYSGYDIILLAYTPDGPSISDAYCRFAKKDNNLVMLKKHCSEYYEGDGFLTAKFIIDEQSVIVGLDFPEIISIGNPSAVLTKQSWFNAMFSAAKLKPAFTHQFGQAYMTDGYFTEYSDPFSRNGFYFRAPDGTAVAYALKVNFMDRSLSKPNVYWNDGWKSEDVYDYTDFTGCGSANYIAVVSPDAVKDRDLTAAGKTAAGETIYTLADSANPLLQDIYNKVYQVFGEQKKVSYDEFISSKPLFFWKDPFGRLIKFRNTKFGSGAECGKPVIYLYPEQTAKVSVKLEPQGGFSYTEPLYNGGWNVTAEPNGKLTNLSDNKVYPYLFWEGRGGIYQSPDKGFVVAQKEVHNFLVEKLAQLGLNKKESADFIEFWEPKMQDSPYYFVSFYGNAVMDQIAPLNISPKPDTVIRILMDFEPLAKPIGVKGYDIKTPARKGFTVVEWGGVLR